jgi:hypothetical protein
MHPSKMESLYNILDVGCVAQEFSKNNITIKAFSVDKSVTTRSEEALIPSKETILPVEGITWRERVGNGE